MVQDFLLRILNKLIDIYLGLKSAFDPSPFGHDLQPFWIRRKEIFSLFDKGIQTDAVGLYSATPEKIANEIAGSFKVASVVDAFCGIGATAIAFAKANKQVYAIDLNPLRLNMARNNADLYKVGDRIIFLQGDFLEIFHKVPADGVFLDPPWGGLGYANIRCFGLKDFKPDGGLLLDLSLKNFKKVAMRVPKQFNFQELERFGREYVFIPNKILGKLYSYTVYFI